MIPRSKHRSRYRSWHTCCRCRTVWADRSEEAVPAADCLDHTAGYITNSSTFEQVLDWTKQRGEKCALRTYRSVKDSGTPGPVRVHRTDSYERAHAQSNLHVHLVVNGSIDQFTIWVSKSSIPSDSNFFSGR